jgi:hypothetical protein
MKRWATMTECKQVLTRVEVLDLCDFADAVEAAEYRQSKRKP